MIERSIDYLNKPGERPKMMQYKNHASEASRLVWEISFEGKPLSE